MHPGAQQTFDNLDGSRFTALLTDQPLAALDIRRLAHAHVEDRPRRQGQGIDGDPRGASLRTAGGGP